MPATPLEDALWRDAIDAARHAPSSHNTQPWIFRRTADGVELLADAARALDVVDPDFRELVISCGAALHHLRVALAARGHGVFVEALPGDTDEPVVARLRLGGRPRRGDEVARMHDAIARRHTDRGRYVAERQPAEPFDHLRTFAADEGAHLTVVDDAERRRALARLVEQADRAQASDLAVLRELVAWLRVPGRHHDDGLPANIALESPARRARREEELVAAGPVLALLTTSHDEPADWLAAGQALSAVLLGATARGLSSSFFDAPIEDPSLRSAVGDAGGVSGVPQLLLRFGHGDGAAASPRRSVDDILL
jgi:nitroreductase